MLPVIPSARPSVDKPALLVPADPISMSTVSAPLSVPNATPSTRPQEDVFPASVDMLFPMENASFLPAITALFQI
jgi:hypothetical protein